MTFSVAKQRLPDMMREHRTKLESVTAFVGGKMMFGTAADVYLRRVQADVSLKPRSKALVAGGRRCSKARCAS